VSKSAKNRSQSIQSTNSLANGGTGDDKETQLPKVRKNREKNCRIFSLFWIDPLYLPRNIMASKYLRSNGNNGIVVKTTKTKCVFSVK
jgi:hypothetical protein